MTTMSVCYDCSQLTGGRCWRHQNSPLVNQRPTPEDRVIHGGASKLDVTIVAAKLGEDLLETRDALVQAEEALRRVQRHVGLLRQYDPDLSMIVARARETANHALGNVEPDEAS